jgi:hypothetical protein
VVEKPKFLAQIILISKDAKLLMTIQNFNAIQLLIQFLREILIGFTNQAKRKENGLK